MTTLTGARVVLREFTRGDVDATRAFGSDPVATRYMDWGPNTVADTAAFLDRTLAQQGDPDRAGAVVRAGGVINARTAAGSWAFHAAYYSSTSASAWRFCAVGRCSTYTYPPSTANATSASTNKATNYQFGLTRTRPEPPDSMSSGRARAGCVSSTQRPSTHCTGPPPCSTPVQPPITPQQPRGLRPIPRPALVASRARRDQCALPSA